MTRARVRLLALAAVALAAAGALALLANAVFVVESELRADDTRLLHTSASEAETSSRGLRFQIADGILGVGDDRSFRDAVRVFSLSRVREVPPDVALARHAQAEAKLTRVMREDADRPRRSTAANLNGILLTENATLDPRTAKRYFELALEAFQTAVRLDPGNEAAKFNLELLMKLLEEERLRVRPIPGQQGASDAASNPSGFGY